MLPTSMELACAKDKDVPAAGDLPAMFSEGHVKLVTTP